MNKVLMFAAGLFVLCGFLAACSDDKNRPMGTIYTPATSQAFSVDGLITTMSPAELSVIQSTTTLSRYEYGIYEICFYGLPIDPLSAAPLASSFGTVHVPSSDWLFQIKNDKDYNFYEVKFGLVKFSNGHIWYQNIYGVNSYTVVVSTTDGSSTEVKDGSWSFSSDSSQIKQSDPAVGFEVGKEFYLNKDAKTKISISYKGLTQDFEFYLRSSRGQYDASPGGS